MRFFTEVKHLWLEQMLELRSYWGMYVGFSLVMPLLMIYGLSHIGNIANDHDSLIRLMAGTSIFAVANEGLCSMAIRVSTMRRDGMLMYYAALPINKLSFIVSLILSRSLIVIPAVIAPILIGPWLYGISVHFDLSLLIVLPLIALLLSSFGVLFGLLSPTVEIAQLTTNVLLFVLALASPVLISWEALPPFLRVASLALPFTYAADALNRVLLGSMGRLFWVDVTVLVGMVGIALFMVTRRLRWRWD